MEFKIVKTVQDPLFDEALNLYDGKLDVSIKEGEKIFRQSLENKYTQHDYIFLVGIDNNSVVSIATAHYEATTNSAFLIYLLAENNGNRDTTIRLTLVEMEKELNKLSNQLHAHDINFIMLEVDQEIDEDESIDDEKTIVLNKRRRLLMEYGFEQQHDIDYIAPRQPIKNNFEEQPMDLFIKSNIELTKDIYGTSIKSNYILKYVFANKISRHIIYPMLEQMDLRKQV